MPASKHTPQQKAAIVAAWRSFSTGTTDQVRFAREQGIAPRTLRTWLKQQPAPGTGGLQDVLQGLDSALQELHRLRGQVHTLVVAQASPVRPQEQPRITAGYPNLANIR